MTVTPPFNVKMSHQSPESIAQAWYKSSAPKANLKDATSSLMAALLAPQPPNQEGKNGKKKKKCRVCSEFEQWGNEAVKNEKPVSGMVSAISTDKSLQETIDRIRKETKHDLEGTPILSSQGMICPPDSQQLGRATWTFLHTMAAYYPDKPSIQEQENAKGFLYSFSKLYPCSYCAKHLQKELEGNVPKVATRQEFSRWMCDLHNEVNVRLGKPVFDCSKVDERWKDGPADGSCD